MGWRGRSQPRRGGMEAVEGRWRHCVASESIAKEQCAIIRIGGQSGPSDLEERQRGGLCAGHGRDGPECDRRVNSGVSTSVGGGHHSPRN
ncbi:hypothetical protein NDU88_004476 [Pleurodeles waltl]|uniref:Uncharacterized protein n=1 Tax=Pleurodeles waltl TaxID=8319 RepID=A0AAV7MVK1_PLEWA|nr:hypothetical protein NDU88_004476 [Pleurodeles waltl]